MDRFTDSVCTVRAVLSACEQRGLDGAEILLAAGLARRSLNDPDARVPVGQVESAWRAARRLSQDPFLALHAAQCLPDGSYGIVDFMCKAAPTAGEAVRRICRYFALINDSVVLAVETGQRECGLYLGSHSGQPSASTIDFIFSAILMHTRRCWEMDWCPRRLELSYPRPKQLEEHERIFRCAFEFEVPASRMVISRTLWETPLPASNPALLKILDDHAAHLLALHPPPADSEARVRSLIGSRMRDGGPRLEAVAREMGYSPRNLQRKLKSIHSSYEQILDDLRARTARYYLRQPGLAVGEIAAIVGFKEASSFTRAFRRWSGITPMQYRKNVANRT
jgi:AraC-like DNA-binding protein